jgi:hypothetical protein
MMIQCPKCGARWESPNGANEMQFVMGKDERLRPAKKKAANTF